MPNPSRWLPCLPFLYSESSPAANLQLNSDLIHSSHVVEIGIDFAVVWCRRTCPPSLWPLARAIASGRRWRLCCHNRAVAKSTSSKMSDLDRFKANQHCWFRMDCGFLFVRRSQVWPEASHYSCCRWSRSLWIEPWHPGLTRSSVLTKPCWCQTGCSSCRMFSSSSQRIGYWCLVLCCSRRGLLRERCPGLRMTLPPIFLFYSI